MKGCGQTHNLFVFLYPLKIEEESVLNPLRTWTFKLCIRKAENAE